MIRNDIYATYNGKEYDVNAFNNGKVYLYSEDEADLANGFCQNSPTRVSVIDGKEYIIHNKNYQNEYIKEITKDDHVEVYSIHTFGIYKDRKFPIYMERDNQYLLGADDFTIAEELGFETRGQGDYEKWVNKSKVKQVSEVKKPMPDFVR